MELWKFRELQRLKNADRQKTKSIILNSKACIECEW
jgi:hypothetical protein